MKVGHRGILRPNDSASLWNGTLSPGWDREESDIFRKALIKFGIGNWKDIMESGCLPGKTNSQMNLQLQRLLGQQSTAEFQGLHIDPVIIGQKNSLETNVKRKGGIIINTGGKLTRQELNERLKSNKQYEEKGWESIIVPIAKSNLEKELKPAVDSKRELLKEKKELLIEYKQELQDVQSRIKTLQN